MKDSRIQFLNLSWLLCGVDVMSKEIKQRDILFNACKAIATNKRTPEWIQKYLIAEVTKAKNVNDVDDISTLELDTPTKHEFKVDEIVSTTKIDKTEYKMKIKSEGSVIDGVKLWNCVIIDGKGPRGVGYEIPNVPETWLKAV